MYNSTNVFGRVAAVVTYEWADVFGRNLALSQRFLDEWEKGQEATEPLSRRDLRLRGEVFKWQQHHRFQRNGCSANDSGCKQLRRCLRTKIAVPPFTRQRMNKSNTARLRTCSQSTQHHGPVATVPQSMRKSVTPTDESKLRRAKKYFVKVKGSSATAPPPSKSGSSVNDSGR